ncbi:hypothetical protein Tsubulata_043688 [Turnera subulata]|uniref:VQ domain-containing protein n=1 Tax=Turnera subulata TaxID=218843 RepID=A0A9Q0G793_9ROSI|nr:hypothetical protein Tsubulata_043688 [Turnera subulata]
MSPVKFHHNEHSLINGPRPAPLMINKASRVTYKHSSTSSSSTNFVAPKVVGGGAKPRNRPVIIYTHSPKVIHTQPKDFMALVQELTGLSRPNKVLDEKASLPPQQEEQLLVYKGRSKKAADGACSDIDNESSSILTDEKYGSGGVGASYDDISGVIKPENVDNNPFFADMPLFTPNSASFFCSPRPIYKFQDSGYESPNVGNLVSPSAFEFLKGLPEY